MSECKQCPHVVGDSYQRDCAFPDCIGGWEEAYKILQSQCEVYREAVAFMMDNFSAYPEAYDHVEKLIAPFNQTKE